MTSYPVIRIKNAWLLRQNASVHLHKLWGKDDDELADDKKVDEIVKSYRKAWEPYEERIVHGICELLGLEFRQNIIDVHVAPWFTAFSDPMVVGVVYEPERFVEIMTHELTHRLLTDNTQTSYDTDYVGEWRQLFGDDKNNDELVHIPVHAIMQAVFDDVLREPKRTANDKEMCKQWPDYDAAWRYVEGYGYNEVIEQLRNSYQQTAKSQPRKTSDLRVVE